MRYNKNNIIYVDFLLSRKKIKSKLKILLYKIYSMLRFKFSLPAAKSNNKSINYFNNHKPSNY